MKIDNSMKSIGGLANSEPRVRSAKGEAASGSQTGTQVELSSLSSRLQEIGQAMANTPVVDSARVAEIKQAIAEGRFQVNAEKVADSLIEDVRQMLANQSSGS